MFMFFFSDANVPFGLAITKTPALIEVLKHWRIPEARVNKSTLPHHKLNEPAEIAALHAKYKKSVMRSTCNDKKTNG